MPMYGRHDSTLRFRGRKSLARRRAHSLIHEPLEAPTVEVFADVDVAFAVDREGMRHVQRSTEDTLLSDVVDDLERLTQKNPDVVVRAVDHIQEALIRREREPRGRPGEQRFRRDESFPHKGTILLENLYAVVDAVGDIHEAVFRQRNVVRQTELLHRRRVRVVRTEVFVVRLVAVCPPHALESQRLGVDYDDAAVPVAVTDIQLIVYGIHSQVRGAAKVLRVGTAAALALMAELRQELTLRREFEDLGVLVAVSRQPDVVFRVDKDAVLGGRPLVALAGATP